MTRKTWTEADIEMLHRDYPNTQTKVLAERLQCTERAVFCQATKYNLCKSPAYLASPAAGRIQPGENIGAATQFKKAQRPHNAGKKGWQAGGNAKKTQFKPGNKPHTWKPIGTERLSKDGYLQRKISDTGYPPKDWVGVHILMWQENHGAVPAGHIVVFRNGNKEGIYLENLELITRAENMQRNTIHRYPPALKNTIRLAGKLRRTIHEKQD